MKVGITGANGFIGRHLVRALADAGLAPVGLVRRDGIEIDGAADVRRIPTLGADTDRAALADALKDLDAVVHLAAHVHVMQGGVEADFINANVAGAALLAEICAEVGITRFVFVSSVKAVGEGTDATPLSDTAMPRPEDAYGRSKLAAEERLAAIGRKSAMKTVILRPTFVYGWPPSGNLKTVISAIRRGLPLPLAGISNRRDMIYVGNLADAVRAALTAENVNDRPYFVSDGEAVSTPDFFRKVGRAFAKPARLFYVPVRVLYLAGAVTGRTGVIDRLTGNLEVDSGRFRRDAGWEPPYNMDQGLRIAAAASTANKPDGT